MTDKGILDIDEKVDLSRLVKNRAGYSEIRRGGRLLYPQKTDPGQLYFSRAQAIPAVLVDWKRDTAA